MCWAAGPVKLERLPQGGVGGIPVSSEAAKRKAGAGEMTQGLGALVFAEDQDSIPSIHTVVHNHP